MESHLQSELDHAVQLAYRELNDPKPREIDGCPCCTDKAELCKLLAKPLRELTSNELRNYGASVFLTLGDVRDFRYFLPRLLEIATTTDWWPSPEVLLGKLKLANWMGWAKANEPRSNKVIDAWYAKCLATAPAEGSVIDALICGIARSGLPLTRRLDALTKIRRRYRLSLTGTHKRSRSDAWRTRFGKNVQKAHRLCSIT
jgi:hypothetical protein